MNSSNVPAAPVDVKDTKRNKKMALSQGGHHLEGERHTRNLKAKLPEMNVVTEDGRMPCGCRGSGN